MGMFDTIHMTCEKCGERFEEQTKGGECGLNHYGLSDAPIDALSGLDRKNIVCSHCGAEYEIVIRYMTSMKLKDEEDNFEYRED